LSPKALALLKWLKVVIRQARFVLAIDEGRREASLRHGGHGGL